MKKPIPYILFNRPVSRRNFIWLAILCPGIALWIYLSARSRGAEFLENPAEAIRNQPV